MTLVTGQEQWVYHDVGYRNNGYVTELVTIVLIFVREQEQWIYFDVCCETGTITAKD